MREFTVSIPGPDQADLAKRLRATRWPALVSDDWDRGVPQSYLREVADYWLNKYDWTETEARINSFDQYLVPVDGAEIHTVHVPSDREDATPLMLIHGWPSSFLEFLPIAQSLANPPSPTEPAFHVVIPSVPGYGFSPHPLTSGWDTARVAQAFDEVMQAFGYQGYITHGGDWGSPIALRMAGLRDSAVRGTHVAMLATFPPNGAESVAALGPEDQAKVGFTMEFEQAASGWRKLQSTRPHTLSYALTDSPIGQFAWISEKFHEWSAPGLVLDTCPIPLKFQVETASLYWFTGSAGTSAELYYESTRTDEDFAATWGGPWPLSSPVNVLELGEDVVRPIREWGEPLLPSLRSWRVLKDVGHFPALEAPEALAEDLRLFALEAGVERPGRPVPAGLPNKPWGMGPR